MERAAKRDRTRVYVADDHPVYRDGLARALRERPEFELVGVGEDGRKALEDLRALEPDVAVLDVRMPGLEGAEVLNAISRDGLPTRVVLLSAYVDPALVYQAIALGAGAYLSKEASRERICDTVAAVARGETVISPETQAGLATEIQARAQTERPLLTPREQQVLRLTASGNSAPQIAAELHLSPATIKTHLQSVYEKLGVSDRAAAVAEGMRRGLLE